MQNTEIQLNVIVYGSPALSSDKEVTNFYYGTVTRTMLALPRDLCNGLSTGNYKLWQIHLAY